MNTISLSPWKQSPVDGGMLRFNRRTGTNVLLRNAATEGLVRLAPRALQIGLLTPCNLSCGFCYRDTSARSVLTQEFLLDLLLQADQWGVQEVAFGGGEPLLFKGFVPLLQQLHAQTRLGLNFTTNGMLLNEAKIAALDGLVGEIRLSAYDNNRYRETLRRAKCLNMGVNFLVTPANVGLLQAYVQDFLQLGARNVLLLGYKGADAALHLGEQGLAQLQQAVTRMADLPLRLDICWHPYLSGVDHLFARSDCGAGDEFLVITPDRQVQPCSFHHEKIPFNTFAELQAIYQHYKQARPAASVQGCTRPLFRQQPPAPANSTWVWQARASNNSGDWTIAAKFCDAATAHKVAHSLRELARAHEAFLASDEGQAFVEGNGYDGSIPTPPLVEYGRQHGFDWSEGLWWEEDGGGASVLTAGTVGHAVVVYHPYCMGLPEEVFRALFQQAGASEMGYWQYDMPAVTIEARGRNDLAAQQAKAHAELVRASEYACDVNDEPPWGSDADDARVADDEDNSARLSDGEHSVLVSDDGIVLKLLFRNTFAGSVAVEQWLQQQGYTDIRVSIQEALTPLPPHAANDD